MNSNNIVYKFDICDPISNNIFHSNTTIPSVCYETNHRPCVQWISNGTCSRIISTNGDNVNVGAVQIVYDITNPNIKRCY